MAQRLLKSIGEYIVMVRRQFIGRLRGSATHHAKIRPMLFRQVPMVHMRKFQRFESSIQFVEKKVYDIKTKGYDDWCADISTRITKIETRSVVWTTAIGIFFVIVQIAIYLLKGVR